MKKIYFAVMLVVLASCDKNYVTGASSSGDGAEIEVKGNYSIVTVDEEKSVISLKEPEIVPGWEVIDLNDTIECVADQVALSQLDYELIKLDTEILEHNMHYVVERGIFEISFYNNDVCIPIRFASSTVSAVRNGKPEEGVYSIRYNVVTKYLETEPLVTNEETHSRSYYDCKIVFFDDSGKIGEIKTKISLYTKNKAISFSASVQEAKEEYVCY